MMDNYLSDELKKIILLAKEEAKYVKASYIDTSHLMLSMIKWAGGVIDYSSVTQCSNDKIFYEDFFKEYCEIIGMGEKDNEFILFSPKVTNSINAVIERAKEINDKANIIDLFIELLLDGQGVAVRLLEQMGINIKNLLIYAERNPDIFNNISIARKIHIKKKEEEKMGNEVNYKFYDAAISIDGNDVISVRKMNIIIVNQTTFNQIKNGKFNFNLEKKDMLQCSYYPFSSIKNNNYIEKKVYMSLFVGVDDNYNFYDYIGVSFKPNSKGNLQSDVKFTLINECYDELKDLYENILETVDDQRKNVLSKHIDNYISGFKNSNRNIIINSEDVYQCQIEEEEKITKEKKEKKDLENKIKELKKCNALVNLNDKVKDNNTIVTGLDDEFNQLLKNLSHMRKPNVMILGEPGVGKTALVEKFACEINNNNVPNIFKNVTLYELSMTAAVAGTKYRGEFEEKIINILNLIKDNPNIIIFIDEAHTIIGAGGAEGAIDASNILKPYLARGSIKVIGATTKSEYEKYIKRDGAIVRRFNNIEILEPLENQTKNIMKGFKPKLETFYNVKISDDIINNCYDKSKMSKNKMPDAALDELENWCIDEYFNNFKNNKEQENKEKEMSKCQ